MEDAAQQERSSARHARAADEGVLLGYQPSSRWPRTRAGDDGQADDGAMLMTLSFRDLTVSKRHRVRSLTRRSV